MPQFRKKPVVIEAVQFTGSNCIECLGFIGEKAGAECLEVHTTDYPVIHTLEGDMTASPGDWIIKGVKGEFYPCKPDIFAATYDILDATYEEEKDPTSYWKAAHDRVVAQNWELSRQIGALQKVGEQCLRPQQTPTGEGEVGDGALPGEANANLNALLRYTGGFYTAAIARGMRAAFAADCVKHVESAARRLHALALAHPQQGGERDGWKLVPVEPTEEMGKAYTEAFWRKMEDMRSPSPTEHPEDGGGPFGYAYRAMLAAAPTSASKSSGEEA